MSRACWAEPRHWTAEALSEHLSRFPELSEALIPLVYYGSSDDRELGLFREVRGSFRYRKKLSLTLTSVVGGLACLNLVTLLRPARLLLFDCNPLQLLLFEMVRRLILQSGDKEDFLARLRERRFSVSSHWERRLQTHLAAKIALDEGDRAAGDSPGVSRRTLERSLRYALNRFERLRELFTDVPYHLFFEDINREQFVAFLLRQPNQWIYLSNIWELPDLLQEQHHREWSPGKRLDEEDTVLAYSRPYRVRLLTAHGDLG